MPDHIAQQLAHTELYFEAGDTQVPPHRPAQLRYGFRDGEQLGLQVGRGPYFRADGGGGVAVHADAFLSSALRDESVTQWRRAA